MLNESHKTEISVTPDMETPLRASDRHLHSTLLDLKLSIVKLQIIPLSLLWQVMVNDLKDFQLCLINEVERLGSV